MVKRRRQSSHWQPISQLLLLASMVEGILENTEEQHQTFLEVLDKPHVLDDAIVQRTQRLYKNQLDDADLYEEQAKVWQEGDLSDSQRKAVEKMLEKLSRIRELSQKILEMLSEIEKGTIERIMAMSDEELGLRHVIRTQETIAKRQSANKKGKGKQDSGSPSEEQHRLAKTIQEWVLTMLTRGDGMEAMLTNMIEQMPNFKRILDTSSSEQMDALCVQYPGFYQFAMLLEDIARGIRDGSIEVPKE